MIGFAPRSVDNRGATALEFALIAAVFIPLCLAVLEAGLLMWTKGALQSAASLAARCAAITSSSCTDVQQFAVTTAEAWVFPGIIDKTNVTPPPSVVCRGGVSMEMVTITSRFWAETGLPPPFNGKMLTAVAYFPTSAAPCI
jgi:uncharacterized membrane protein